MIWGTAIVAFGLLAAVLIVTALTVDDWSRDLTTNVAETSWDAADMQPVVTTADADMVEQAARHLADRSPNWEYEGSESTADATSVHLVRVTRWLRFRDDVTLTVTSNGDGTATIHIRSASRIGKGDLGQNPRNIRAVREALATSEQLAGTLKVDRPAPR